MKRTRWRMVSNTLLVVATLGLSYAVLSFGGPVVARATTRPYPGRDAIGRQKGAVARMAPAEALAELERLEVGDAESIARASELVAAGMVHYWPGPTHLDEALECRFLEHPDLWLRMRWGRWADGGESERVRLGRLERFDWRTALLVGVGYCSQQSTVLARYLRERGVAAFAMGLGGHVVTVAMTPEGEWVLDPDYGVVIRHSLGELAERPVLVREHYEAIGSSPDRLEQLVAIYAPEGNSEYHGGEIEIGRVEGRPEQIRRVGLWGGLAALAGGLWLRRLARNPQQASGEAALHRDAA